MSKFADLMKNKDKEPIKEQFVEQNREIIAQNIEKSENEKPKDGEIKQNTARKSAKAPHQSCIRCHADLGTVDHWFDFGIKRVQYGYTMMPEPLCKECFKDLQAFMVNGDRLNS